VDTIWRLFFIGDSLAKRMTSAAEEQQQQVAIANVWKQLHYDQLKQQLEKMFGYPRKAERVQSK